MSNDPNEQKRERRAFQRYEVMAYARQLPETTNRYYFVQDLSEAGAFLVSQSKPVLGTILKLNISIRFLSEFINTEARVVRHDEKGFGVAFKSIPVRDLEILRSYLYRDNAEKILSRFKSQKNEPDTLS